MNGFCIKILLFLDLFCLQRPSTNCISKWLQTLEVLGEHGGGHDSTLYRYTPSRVQYGVRTKNHPAYAAYLTELRFFIARSLAAQDSNGQKCDIKNMVETTGVGELSLAGPVRVSIFEC